MADSSDPTLPWYRRRPAMILLFLCLSPVWAVLVWTDRRSGTPVKVFAGIILLLGAFMTYNAVNNPSIRELREGAARWSAATPEQRLDLFFSTRDSAWSPLWEITGITRTELEAQLGPPDHTNASGHPVYLGTAPTGVPQQPMVTIRLDENGRVESLLVQQYDVPDTGLSPKL